MVQPFGKSEEEFWVGKKDYSVAFEDRNGKLLKVKQRY